MATEIFKGDLGTVIRLTTGIDLTGNSLLQIWIKKPDGTFYQRTASVVGAASDGIIEYTTISVDLDEAGTYSTQAHVEFSAGAQKFNGTISEFDVIPELA